MAFVQRSVPDLITLFQDEFRERLGSNYHEALGRAASDILAGEVDVDACIEAINAREAASLDIAKTP